MDTIDTNSDRMEHLVQVSFFQFSQVLWRYNAIGFQTSGPNFSNNLLVEKQALTRLSHAIHACELILGLVPSQNMQRSQILRKIKQTRTDLRALITIIKKFSQTTDWIDHSRLVSLANLLVRQIRREYGEVIELFE